MNTEQIDRLIRDHVWEFDGVFSADRLPRNPHLLVCNTDASHLPGEHWIAIYVDEDGLFGEFFDSLAREPSYAFRCYMNRHCLRWTFNDRQLQSVVSRFCGHYCVFYCILRSRGINMCRIVNSFTNDTGFNDLLVHGFICRQ